MYESIDQAELGQVGIYTINRNREAPVGVSKVENEHPKRKATVRTIRPQQGNSSSDLSRGQGQNTGMNV